MTGKLSCYGRSFYQVTQRYWRIGAEGTVRVFGGIGAARPRVLLPLLAVG
jgi:hypothetical protein